MRQLIQSKKALHYTGILEVKEHKIVHQVIPCEQLFIENLRFEFSMYCYDFSHGKINISDVDQVSLLLTLKKFHTLLWVFYC